jgi:hypothetical protein
MVFDCHTDNLLPSRILYIIFLFKRRSDPIRSFSLVRYHIPVLPSRRLSKMDKPRANSALCAAKYKGRKIRSDLSLSKTFFIFYTEGDERGRGRGNYRAKGRLCKIGLRYRRVILPPLTSAHLRDDIIIRRFDNTVLPSK